MTFFEVAADVDAFQYFLLDDVEDAWRWNYGGDRRFIAGGMVTSRCPGSGW